MAFVDMDRIKKSVTLVLQQYSLPQVPKQATLDYIRAHQPPGAPRKLSRKEQDEIALLRRVRDALHGDSAA